MSQQKTRERLAWTVESVGLQRLPWWALPIIAKRAAGTGGSCGYRHRGRNVANLHGDFAGPVALSPDGKALVFGASDAQGKITLWERDLSGLHAHKWLGPMGQRFHFGLLMGGRWVILRAAELQTVQVKGARRQIFVMHRAAVVEPGDAQGIDFVLSTVSERHLSGASFRGSPTPVTTLDRGNMTVIDGHISPDGRHFLYLAVNRMVEREPNDAISLPWMAKKIGCCFVPSLTRPMVRAVAVCAGRRADGPTFRSRCRPTHGRSHADCARPGSRPGHLESSL
jgi:hypothetical protein